MNILKFFKIDNIRKFINYSTRAFTLIELLVVVTIMILISSVTLANYSKFGSQILHRNLAYSVGLVVRQAQVYGLSSNIFNGKFSTGHGIYIDIINDNTKLTLYTDIDKNNFFTTSPIQSKRDEEVEIFSMSKGFRISKICISLTSGNEDCSMTKTDIIFKRPEPDAIIRASGSSFVKYDRVRIVIESPNGEEISVVVETAGQISVRK